MKQMKITSHTTVFYSSTEICKTSQYVNKEYYIKYQSNGAKLSSGVSNYVPFLQSPNTASEIWCGEKKKKKCMDWLIWFLATWYTVKLDYASNTCVLPFAYLLIWDVKCLSM